MTHNVELSGSAKPSPIEYLVIFTILELSVIGVIEVMTIGIMNNVIAYAEEWKQFKAMCDSMGEGGKKLMEERLARMRLEEQRRHEIAVADAGRARNFWGQ